MRTLKRAILMILLYGAAAVAVIAGVWNEQAVEREALRDEFVELATTEAMERRAGWDQVGLLRQAWARAQRVCDEADSVEQDGWPQRTSFCVDS